MGLDLLVEFEFRTTRTTGVLLGISSQKMDGMGIEMIDEKVSVSNANISDFFIILLMCRYHSCVGNSNILKPGCILCWEKAKLYVFVLLDYFNLCMFSACCRPV